MWYQIKLVIQHTQFSTNSRPIDVTSHDTWTLSVQNIFSLSIQYEMKCIKIQYIPTVCICRTFAISDYWTYRKIFHSKTVVNRWLEVFLLKVLIYLWCIKKNETLEWPSFPYSVSENESLSPPYYFLHKVE